MRDDIYVALAEAVQDYSLSFADEFEDSLDEMWEGRPYGQKDLTDLQFMMWYEQMMGTNPNWQAASMFTPDGPNMLKRYLSARTRLAQKMEAGNG